MRLRPVANSIFLEANQDTSINNIFVPKGTSILTLSRAEAIQDKYFPNAKTFNPDRWFDPIERRKLVQHPTYRPFGYGPRLCPGRSLAYLKIRSVVAMLCKNFQLSKGMNPKPVEEIMDLTMTAKNVVVRLTSRR